MSNVSISSTNLPWPGQINQDAFQVGLHRWVNEAPVGEKGNREIAKERMIAAKNEEHTILGLDYLGLTTLPPEIGTLNSLKHLNLSHNQLAALPPVIGTLNSLTHLDLSHNQLAALPPEIGTLNSLTYLVLSHNQLAALPPEIGTLNSLTLLNLSHNQLAALPPEIGSLTYLNLSHNQLAALPPVIGTLNSLTYLNLSHNQLAALPPVIGTLNSLTSLRLSHNQLAALPNEIGNLNSLTLLNLSHNQLAALPNEIGNLNSLTSLDLSHNQLAALPPVIGTLNSLTSLYLSHNQLAALPNEIGTLNSLTYLDLSHNQLAALPPVIGTLNSLTSLDLSHNQLAALPNEIGTLNRLTFLSLDHNQLAALPPEIGTLNNLALLRLDNNPLDSIFRWTNEFKRYFPNNDRVNLRSLLGHMPRNRDDADLMIAFFRDVSRMADYTSEATRKHALFRIYLILLGIASNPEFLESMLQILRSRVVACEDEVAITFSEIEIQYLLHCRAPQANLNSLCTILIGIARYHLVTQRAQDYARRNGLGDHIEIILFCKLKLKELLEFPIAVEGMFYREVGEIPQEELDRIADEILEETSDADDQMQLLMQHKIWIKKVENQYEGEIAAINGKFGPFFEAFIDAEMSDEAKKATLTDTGINPEGKTMYELLEEVEKARTTRIHALVKAKTVALLN